MIASYRAVGVDGDDVPAVRCAGRPVRSPRSTGDSSGTPGHTDRRCGGSGSVAVAMPSTEADLVGRLRAAGCVFAEDEARLLTTAASGPADLDAMPARRVAGDPLEHVLGWAEFCGRRIAVDPGVFVPRRRTEFLVQYAASLAGPGDVVVDLCCGSGAIGAALAAAVPGIEVHAADVDPAAVRCAWRNLPAA